MNQVETELMLQRLSVAQEKLPLVLEMAKLEEDALRESRLGFKKTTTKSDQTLLSQSLL